MGSKDSDEVFFSHIYYYLLHNHVTLSHVFICIAMCIINTQSKMSSR